MMKKALFMLAMLTCILAGCSGGGNDEPINPTPKPEEVKAEITLDSSIVSNGLSFGVASGEQIVSFSANTNWTLSVASTTSGATWCKASATSGSKGNATVKFTIDENTSYDDRSVSVTIKAGTASKTFTITQKGADALLVTTNKYEVAQEGGKIEVEVKANINYELAISETAKDWITESKSRALTTHKHTFEIALNEESEKREGEITFKSGDKVETVKVYQAGGAIILLSQNEYTVNDAGETISVDIKSNVEYGVQMPDVDWIADEVSSRRMSSHTLKYVILPNEGYDSRSTEIIFYDKNSDLKETLKVVQVQKDAIVISKKTYDVKAEGETIEVKLSANVDFEVAMPEVDWIKQTDSRALKEHTFYFEVLENEGEDNRSAKIIYTNKESGVENIVTVKQEGTKPKADVTINVTEAGTLSSHIAEDRISTLESLKIVGDLNGDDFKVIQQMQSLIILDLSDANITNGGDYYTDIHGGYNGTPFEYLYVETNKLSARLIPSNIEYFYFPKSIEDICGMSYAKNIHSPFSGCRSIWDYNYNRTNSNLKYIDFYSNLEHIGPYAFWRTNIEAFTFPEKVDTIGKGAFAYCKLKSININNKIKVVDDESFTNNISLAIIKISEGVEEIGKEAFYRCRNEEITLPSSIKEIKENCFTTTYDNIPEVTKIHFSDVNKWCEVKLGNIYSSPFYLYKGWSPNNEVNSHLYLNNKLVTSLDINNVETINNYVFAGCKSLEKITIGNKAKSIGIESFKSCTNITDLKLGNNIEVISQGAFSNCEKLETVILGTAIKIVDKEAFENTMPTEVYCYATIPPSIVSSSNFNKIDKDTAKLYVPKGTYSAYYLSDWGSIFNNIIEMD